MRKKFSSAPNSITQLILLKIWKYHNEPPPQCTINMHQQKCGENKKKCGGNNHYIHCKSMLYTQ
jgi:hypothetical protein